MPADELPCREKKALCRREFGRVGRVLDYMESLEMRRHGVRGIGKSSVSKRICGQEVAKLVVDMGLGHRQQGQHADPAQNAEDPDQNYAQAAPPSQTAKSYFGYLKPARGRRSNNEGEERRQ